MSLRDISTLSFKKGIIGPDKRDQENSYMSLLQRGLNQAGVAFPNNGAGSKTDIVSDVSDFSTYSVTGTDTIFVKDPYRGGQFSLYTGSDSADNGMIFLDADGNKWKRVTQDGVINAWWYGMESYLVTRTDPENDSYAKFMAAVQYIYDHNEFTTLYIPYDTRGVHTYFFRSTVVIDHPINIIGDGFPHRPLTTLLWEENLTCFSITSDNGTLVGMSTLAIYQNEPVSHIHDYTAHGVDTRSYVHLHNLNFFNNISGNAVNIASCASLGSPIYGNADHSIVEEIQVVNATNGLYIEGCDANVIDIRDCSFASCRHWGSYDNGFLGNLYYNCHYANNGKTGECIVTFGGLYYVSEDFDDNINKRPDLFPAYWYEIGAMGGALPWDAGTHYYSGGAAAVVNINAFTQFEHCYTESFQPPIILNARSSVNGGTNGADIRNGVQTRVNFGNYIVTNDLKQSAITADRLYAGVTPLGYYSLFTESEAYTNTVLKSTGANIVELRMSNTTNDYGGISYLDNKMLAICEGQYITETTPTSFVPYADNSFDLGTPSLKWKSLNAVNIRLSGVVEYADNAAALLGGLVAGDPYRTGDNLKIVH